MRSYTITVGGQTLQIRSDADQAHIDSLAADLNERYRVIEKKGPRASQEIRAMTMVAIILLDELKEAQKQRDFLRVRTREFTKRLIDRIDEALSHRTS